MTIKDIFDDLKSEVMGRFNSPLLFSFAISWCIWNYKFLMIVFSSNSVSVTLELISKISFPDEDHVVKYGLLFPLSTALIYIFAYPYPARFVYQYNLLQQRLTRLVQRRFFEETPLTLEESRKFRQEIDQKVQELVDEVDRKNSEIARLKSTINELTGQLERIGLSASKSNRSDRVTTDSELQLLATIATADPHFFKPDTSKMSVAEKIKFDYELDELVAKGLVERFVSNNRHAYQPTHSGRRELLRATANSD